MKIDRRTVGTVEVCAPQDALADDGAEAFSQALLSYVNGTNPRVVVAMDEVGFMDSVALEGLVTAGNELNARSQQLKLAGVTATCREILELTGLSDRFQFFEDVDAAVRSFL